jgi:hypothetical protein
MARSIKNAKLQRTDVETVSLPSQITPFHSRLQNTVMTGTLEHLFLALTVSILGFCWVSRHQDDCVVGQEGCARK